MFTLRDPLLINREIAGDLAVVTDEIFGETEIDTANAFEFMLGRSDIVSLVDTLLYGCFGLMGMFVVVDPDRSICEASDILAEAVIGHVWASPQQVRLGQALLRIELDGGSLADLPGDLRLEIGDDPGLELIVTLLKLVTGMSLMLARDVGQASAGDPLRQVFDL